jgi:hypothetical protein
VRKAENYVDGDTFRNGYIEAALKDTLDLGNAVAAVRGVRLPSHLLDKSLDTFLEAQSMKGHTPDLTADQALQTGSYLFIAAKNTKSPDHQWARDMLQKYLKIDPDTNYAYLPQVRATENNNELRQIIEDLRADLASGQVKAAEDRQKVQMSLKRAEALMAIVTKRLQEGVDTTKKERRDDSHKAQNQIRAERLKEGFDELANGFGALSGIATLAGDPQSARMLNKSAALTQGISQAIQVSLNRTIAQSPMLYANVYVGVAVLAAEMLQSSQEQNTMGELFAQLREISKQLEELREEIDHRFNVLDKELKQYFERAFFDLANIRASVARLERYSNQIKEALDRANFETKTGLKFLWLSQMTDWQTKCLSADARLTEVLFRRCRNQFALVAAGTWNTALASPLTDTGSLKGLEKTSDLEYGAVKTALEQLDPSQAWDLINVNPANWVFGSRLLVDLFHRNSRFITLASDSGLTGRDDLSLKQIIKCLNLNRNGCIISQIPCVGVKPIS